MGTKAFRALLLSVMLLMLLLQRGMPVGGYGSP